MSESSSLHPGGGQDDSPAPRRSMTLLTATVCLLGAGLGVNPQPSRADTPPPIRWGGGATAGATHPTTAQPPSAQLTSQQSKVQAAGGSQHTSPSLVSSQHKWSAGSPSPGTTTPATNHAKWRGATNAKVVSPTSHQWKPKTTQSGTQGPK